MSFPSLASLGKFLGLIGVTALVMVSFTGMSRARQDVPDPVLGRALAEKHGREVAVFAGGCFWGVEAVFEHVKGVSAVRSGYAGGSPASANYAAVSAGRTSHAESVEITFDPAVVSYGQLLKVFFSVAHDPTQLDRQGPDRGSQYRSAIFYRNADQQRIAAAYVRQMTQAGTWGKQPIVTRIVPLKAFHPAERYHQDFARLNPDHPYIRHWDAPKVARLKREFPGLYVH